jgi:hypothetical protein
MAGVKNSNKISVNTNYFMGGVTVDPKLGVANSFYYSKNLDFRTIPSQMSVLPAPSALTGFTDLVQDIQQDLNGVRWGIGSAGNLYQIDTSDNVTLVNTLSENGSAGLLYNQVTDQLYIPGQTKVSTYGQVTTGNPGQPVFKSDNFAQSVSTGGGCTQLYNSTTLQYDLGLRSAATLTYSVPVTLSEAATASCPFSPDIEPGYSIQVKIVSKGTGDWTLTLHDSQNNSLAAVTVANASLTNSTFNEFVFGKQVRVLVGSGGNHGAANYHFHLTSTVADGTASVVTASDLSTANFTWHAYRLVQTNNGWHPTAMFYVQSGTGTGMSLCIGNGNYLSTYNFSNDNDPLNTAWVRHQLVFAPGYEVCGLSTNNQYLVIALERRSSNASRSFQDGKLVFWDGTTSAASFTIDVPMGAPYGLSTFNNVTYFIIAGSLYAWSGGQTVIKVRRLAYQNTDYLGTVDTTIVNPNMLTSRYSVLMMGYPTSTTNQNIDYGVWSWGTAELTFPNSYGLSYTLSNGYLNNVSPVSNLKIGCCINFVDHMYISWSYTLAGTTHYGMDVLTNSSYAARSGSWKSLIFDGGARYKQKQAGVMKVSFETLPTGCTVTPFYIIDRGSTVTGTAVTSGTNALLTVNKRFHEIQYGFTFTCPASLTTPIVFTGVTMEIDPTQAEVDVTKDM